MTFVDVSCLLNSLHDQVYLKNISHTFFYNFNLSSTMNLIFSELIPVTIIIT